MITGIIALNVSSAQCYFSLESSMPNHPQEHIYDKGLSTLKHNSMPHAHYWKFGCLEKDR